MDERCLRNYSQLPTSRWFFRTKCFWEHFYFVSSCTDSEKDVVCNFAILSNTVLILPGFAWQPCAETQNYCFSRQTWRTIPGSLGGRIPLPRDSWQNLCCSGGHSHRCLYLWKDCVQAIATAARNEDVLACKWKDLAWIRFACLAHVNNQIKQKFTKYFWKYFYGLINI